MSRVALFCFALLTAMPVRAEDPPRDVRIGYVDLAQDPEYGPARNYAGLVGTDRASPFPGAELAIRDAEAIGSAIGVRFSLVHRSIAEGDDPAAAVATLAVLEKLEAVVLDLPLDATESVALAPANAQLVLLDTRQRSDELRAETCAVSLFHILPSQAMLQDALAQFLAARNWKRVLLLEGPAPDDRAISTAFRRAAKKFGLRIVAARSFVAGNDPRKRDQINVALLTSELDYDVVYVAEAKLEFARYVPYQTYLARPVVGSTGLMSDAWHAAWERHGAPQLTRRFFRLASRPMTSEDWAAWAAIRAIVEAVVRGQGARPLREMLLDQSLTLELYKGAPGSFRPWDHQLRQPILLHTSDAVVGLAPLDGFSHETSTLDTLGFDKPEFHCRAQ